MSKSKIFNLTAEQQIHMQHLLDSNELQLYCEENGPFTSYREAYLHYTGERTIGDYENGKIH